MEKTRDGPPIKTLFLQLKPKLIAQWNPQVD
jgi:hypothetical protein